MKKLLLAASVIALAGPANAQDATPDRCVREIHVSWSYGTSKRVVDTLIAGRKWNVPHLIAFCHKPNFTGSAGAEDYILIGGYHDGDPTFPPSMGVSGSRPIAAYGVGAFPRGPVYP